MLAVLEGVAVKVVVLVLDQAVPVTVCVIVKEAVLDRVAVRLGVVVMVSERVWVADNVEWVVVVPVRLGVRLPEAVTVGVPVLTSELVGEPEGVPEMVTDPEPVNDTLFVCVALRVTVEDCVVDRVAVPEGFIVPDAV